MNVINGTHCHNVSVKPLSLSLPLVVHKNAVNRLP